MEGEDTPNRAYWTHCRLGINSLHPSCGVATPTPMATAPASPTPMETEEAMPEDQDKTVRVVTYREDRGGREERSRNSNSNTGNQARRETRGDRNRRGDRHRGMREQERERGAARRQRDRGDRAFRARGPRK